MMARMGMNRDERKQKGFALVRSLDKKKLRGKKPRKNSKRWIGGEARKKKVYAMSLVNGKGLGIFCAPCKQGERRGGTGGGGKRRVHPNFSFKRRDESEELWTRGGKIEDRDQISEIMGKSKFEKPVRTGEDDSR